MASKSLPSSSDLCWTVLCTNSGDPTQSAQDFDARWVPDFLAQIDHIRGTRSAAIPHPGFPCPGPGQQLFSQQIERATGPVWWRGHVNVVQTSEHFVFRFQSFAHSAQRIVDAKTEEQWHQRISLFSSLGLMDPVLRPSVIGPHIRCGLGVKRPHEWEQSSKSWHLMQFCEKTASENVIVRSHAVNNIVHSGSVSSGPLLRVRRSRFLPWSKGHTEMEHTRMCEQQADEKMCLLRFLAPRRLSSAMPSWLTS